MGESDVVNSREWKPMVIMDPTSLIGRLYYSEPEKTGVKELIKIQEIFDQNDGCEYTLDPLEFRSLNPKGNYEEVITYNEVIDRVLDDDVLDMDNISNNDVTFKYIIDHIGPIKVNDYSYNGSLWNVKVMKRYVSVDEIHFKMMESLDTITCSKYSYKNIILKK